MIHPYHLHLLAKLYHEEALQEARKRHLVERARTSRDPRGSKRSGLSSWRSAPALLRGVASSE